MITHPHARGICKIDVPQKCVCIRYAMKLQLYQIRLFWPVQEWRSRVGPCRAPQTFTIIAYFAMHKIFAVSYIYSISHFHYSKLSMPHWPSTVSMVLERSVNTTLLYRAILYHLKEVV